MATSAFRSNTKRNPIAGDAASSYRPALHRRSRSLSRQPPPPDPPDADGPPRGRFVNTVRGSGFSDAELEGLSEFFLAIGDEAASEEARRGRSAGRRVPEVGGVGRRGRSVVRKGVSDGGSGGKGVSDGGSGRRRSISVARYRYSNSENDMDQHRNSSSNEKTKKVINGSSQTPSSFKSEGHSKQRTLRRSLSQLDLRRAAHDGYSSYSSAVTDDEALDARNDNGNEKTIRAVYAQKKSDHPTGEVVENGLLEVMRKEVQHAVEEIRTELEHVMVKNKPVPSGGDYLPPDGAEVVQAIGEIRRSYTKKLEQIEKRKRDLLAELAVEEQRGLEISRIVRELLPDSGQTTKLAKQSPPRKRNNDKSRMSRRLTEEAEKYFEDFLSNVEDTDFSSIDGERSDASSTLAGSLMFKEPIPCNRKGEVSDSLEKGVSLPAEMDGVVLPWLQWETSNYGTPLLIKKSAYNSVQDVSMASSSFASSSPNCNSSCSIISGTNRYPDTESYPKKGLAGLSSFNKDEYLQFDTNEDLLFERFKQRHRIESGGLLICGRTFY